VPRVARSHLHPEPCVVHDPERQRHVHIVPSVYQPQLINWLTIFIFGSMTCTIPTAHHSALIRNKRNLLSSNHSLYIYESTVIGLWRGRGCGRGECPVTPPSSLPADSKHFSQSLMRRHSTISPQTSRCGVNSSVSRDQCVVKRKYSSKVALGSQNRSM
jgi:hypothetical protein